MVIWYILWPFGIFYGHLVYFSPRFGTLNRENSGNPDRVPGVAEVGGFLVAFVVSFFWHQNGRAAAKKILGEKKIWLLFLTPQKMDDAFSF
jgi:hypothetical protein